MGLRERKKQETRQRISDVATALFAQRGFDAVTVVEVAAAANVSKMTVFNYFPRKEDLILDRAPEAIALLTGAVRERAPGVGAVAAVRELALDLVARGHPLSAVGRDHRLFWRTVLGAPSLRDRARELTDELEAALAEALNYNNAAMDAVSPAAAQMQAALVMAVLKTAFRTAAQRQLAGDNLAEIDAGQPALLNQWFDALERALNG